MDSGQGHRSVVDPEPLDAILSRWHWRSRHTAFIPHTTAKVAFATVATVTRAEVTSSAALQGADPTVTLLEQLARRGFFPLSGPADPEATAMLLGRIGHLWQAASRTGSAAEFASFDEPGYARAALLLAVHQCGEDALMVAEARVLATDEHTVDGLSRQWLRTAWSRRLPLAELLSATRARLGTGRHSDRRGG